MILTNGVNELLAEGHHPPPNRPHRYPFWDCQLAEEYARWWDPGSQCIRGAPDGSLAGLDSGWFDVTHLSYQSRFGRSCDYACVDIAPTDLSSGFETRKIRAYPTTDQKHILRKMSATTRMLYNRAIDFLHDRRRPSTLASVRQAVFPNAACALSRECPWINETPKYVRDAAMGEAVEAHKAALTNMDRGNIREFDLKHRRRDLGDFVLSFASESVSGSTFMPRHRTICFGRLQVNETMFLRKAYDTEVKVQRDEYGRHWMIIVTKRDRPRKAQKKKRKKKKRKRTRRHQSHRERMWKRKVSSTPPSSESECRPVVAVDPGVRTRHAIWSTDGSAILVGKGSISRIYRNVRHFDRCLSAERDTSSCHEIRRRLKRKRLRLMRLIDHLRDDIDRKTISYLVRTAGIVLLPSFEVSGMVRRRRRRINNQTARNLLNWAHYRFKQRLLTKAASSSTCTVMIVPEDFTTKTCRCGVLLTVGGNKVVKCATCGYTCERDLHGAANIFKRALRHGEGI